MAATWRSFAPVGLAVIGLGSVFVAPTGATAAMVTLNSMVHGVVRDFAPQDGLGDANGTNINVLNFVGSAQDRGVIEFDISSLTTPVTSAVLKLTQTSSNLIASRTFGVWGYTGNGTLENADYSPSGASVLGTFQHEVEPTENFDVTSFINLQIALNEPLHFASLLILWESPPENRFVQFGRADVAGSYPTMEVALLSTPIPAALPLFASALIGFGLMGYRRRKAQVAS